MFPRSLLPKTGTAIYLEVVGNIGPSGLRGLHGTKCPLSMAVIRPPQSALSAILSSRQILINHYVAGTF